MIGRSQISLDPEMQRRAREKAAAKVDAATLARDARALIDGLKSGHVGAVGLDVYEEEEHLFFEDHSSHVIQDDVFARLLTFPNVVVTAHQAFFTQEALRAISETTLDNISAFEQHRRSGNELC